MNENISKSQQKRDVQALNQLGKALIDLNASILATFPLGDALYQAIIEAKKLKTFSAQKRQLKLIGKLIRANQPEDILNAYSAYQAENDGTTAHFQLIELWRSRLLQEGNAALTDFIAAYQPEDLQKLKHLIKKATTEEADPRNNTAALALFRYLRSCIS